MYVFVTRLVVFTFILTLSMIWSSGKSSDESDNRAEWYSEYSPLPGEIRT